MPNFIIYHNSKTHKLNEAPDFDHLANTLSVYRKAGYSNLNIYHATLKGQRVDNQPDNNGGQTGFFHIDFYGCWYEIEPDNGTENYFMIGEYPHGL